MRIVACYCNVVSGQVGSGSPGIVLISTNTTLTLELTVVQQFEVLWACPEHLHLSVAALYLCIVYPCVMPICDCAASKAFQQVSVGQDMGGVVGPSAVRQLALSFGVRNPGGLMS